MKRLQLRVNLQKIRLHELIQMRQSVICRFLWKPHISSSVNCRFLWKPRTNRLPPIADNNTLRSAAAPLQRTESGRDCSAALQSSSRVRTQLRRTRFLTVHARKDQQWFTRRELFKVTHYSVKLNTRRRHFQGSYREMSARIPRCQCAGCRLKNCRRCKNCQDMKQYGGRGTRKQKCLKKFCLRNFMSDLE